MENVNVNNSQFNHLKGIGGWLILVAISLVITAIRFVIDLMSWCSSVFSSDSMEVIADGDYPFLLPFLVFEGVTNLLFFIAYIYLNIQFFTKNYRTPKLFTMILLGNLAFIVVDAIFAGLIFDEPMFDGETAIDLIRLVIYCAIWIPYFAVSIRVKNTFVEGKPSCDMMGQKPTLVS